jgi:hypothetical protein
MDSFGFSSVGKAQNFAAQGRVEDAVFIAAFKSTSADLKEPCTQRKPLVEGAITGFYFACWK